MAGGRRSERYRAIVLDRTKLAEQDLILTMLSSDGTQLRAVAKGARKPGGRLASRSELFSEIDVLISLGRGLGIVSEAALVEPHAHLRGDLDRVSAASAMAEVARLTCFEGIEDPFLYALLSRALRAAEEAADQPRLDLAVAAYALKVTSHAGWRPELEACMACGDQQISHFSALGGGVLCASCAKDVSGVVEIDGNALAWLRALIKLTFDDLLAAEIDGPTASWLLTLAHTWCAAHLEARLRAFEFLLSL